MIAAGLSINYLITRDLSDVLDIEATVTDQPRWTDSDLFRTLRCKRMIGLIAREPCGRAAAYVIYEVLPDALVLIRLVVHAGCRRRGIGRTLIRRFVEKLTVQRRYRLIVRVPETHVAAQLFLRSCGLRVVAIERGSGSDEDVYHFEYRLPLEDHSKEIA